MPDDPRHKRAATHGDRNDSRRHRPHGVPVHVDPEVTPPPQEPPRPSSRPGYDSIPPPIRAQFDALADDLGGLTEAIGKVWDARKDGARLDRIDDKLGAVAGMLTRHQTILDDNLIPQLDRWRATTDELAAQLPRISAALEGLSLMVSSIDRQQRQLELEVRTDRTRTEGTLEQLNEQVDGLRSDIARHERRVAELEQARRDERVGTRAISKRDKKLIGLAVGGASVVTFIAAKWSWFVSLFTR